MRGKLTLLAGVCAAAVATPSFAQSANSGSGVEEIIVTAQRQSQRLQDVPIAVSAFTAENLEKQQIKNTSDLQLTLPNVTFTKTNFTSASFTIRGIGDLCVGVTCDSATGIAMNDAPLFGTRLFEGEFYDLAQIEVLRGPQGTLFGRNATSGVVNFRTAKPDLNKFGASGEAEYGNYNSVKVKGMINAPITDTFGVRVAGFYLNRDGYTKNLYNNERIDDRDMYGIRGSITWEPTPDTTIDLMGQYFSENDHRLRIQKQLCDRDPTGVLGCLNSGRGYGTTNGNSQFGNIFAAKQAFGILGINSLFAAHGIGSPALGDIYGADVYSNAVNPKDPREVYMDHTPTYKTNELLLQGRLTQKLGEKFSLRLTGNYQRVTVDSQQDYNLSVQNRAGMQAGLNALAAAAADPVLGAYFKPVADALIPDGPNGKLCTSLPDRTGTGVYGGHAVCAMTPLDFDKSSSSQSSWTAEAVLSSDLDGPFNFLVGANYANVHVTDASYWVDSFGLDYLNGVYGATTAFNAGLPPSYFASPYYHSDSTDMHLKSFGIFGEAYFKFNDRLKLTAGLRYNHDDKKNVARTTLLNFLTPFGTANAYNDSPFFAAQYDADPSPDFPGNQDYQRRQVKFSELTGRAVLDFQVTPDNLVYASYSRGYKSGGINPPLSVNSDAVNIFFKPEFVNAFEIGSKNTFANGAMQLNLTAFYYKYKALQLSRIFARTSVNDNVDANIWGVEAEAIFRPVRELTINANFSYLNTKVSQDKWLVDTRDVGAGRADAVIIKDAINGSNCAVASKSGDKAGVNNYVNTVNGLLGLQGTTEFPAGSGVNSTGAYSLCSLLGSLAPTLGESFGGIETSVDHNGEVTDYTTGGIPVNIKGRQLPGAPRIKFSAGVQYDIHIGDMTLTPRADMAFTGEAYGTIFNGVINKIPAFTQVNAQIELDGPDKKWFIRGFIQNITNNNSITGLYATDQSSGLFTNVFTLEPRRYGVTAGFKF